MRTAMTLSNKQQLQIKHLLIENPKITVEEIKAKLGRDGAALTSASIAELRADVQHCRRLLEEEGLLSPAKKPPGRTGSVDGKQSPEAKGANAQSIARPRSTGLQARIKNLLNENPDISVDQIRAQLGRDGAFVSPESIAELRADVMHCRRLLKEQGLVSPAKKSKERPGSEQSIARPRPTGLQARITQLLNENPDISVDQIRAQLGRDGAFVSPESIAELRADVMHCRRLLKEQGLLPPVKK